MPDDGPNESPLAPEDVVDDPRGETPLDADAPDAVIPGDPASAPGAPDAAGGHDGARLVVKRNGTETAETFSIGPSAIIGRFDPAVGPVDVDLGPLPEGAYVSRRHARVSRAEGAWRVEDLGSSNGTFVLRNGDFERVESADLGDGDEFALGNARFVLRSG